MKTITTFLSLLFVISALAQQKYILESRKETRYETRLGNKQYERKVTYQYDKKKKIHTQTSLDDFFTTKDKSIKIYNENYELLSEDSYMWNDLDKKWSKVATKRLNSTEDNHAEEQLYLNEKRQWEGFLRKYQKTENGDIIQTFEHINGQWLEKSIETEITNLENNTTEIIGQSYNPQLKTYTNEYRRFSENLNNDSIRIVTNYKWDNDKLIWVYSRKDIHTIKKNTAENITYQYINNSWQPDFRNISIKIEDQIGTIIDTTSYYTPTGEISSSRAEKRIYNTNNNPIYEEEWFCEYPKKEYHLRITTNYTYDVNNGKLIEKLTTLIDDSERKNVRKMVKSYDTNGSIIHEELFRGNTDNPDVLEPTEKIVYNYHNKIKFKDILNEDSWYYYLRYDSMYAIESIKLYYYLDNQWVLINEVLFNYKKI
ncbi:MAG: hypothetical protein Q4B43_04350 [Bacteroidota bacterium]|nr:hypothetical protein [Bacteroidota bacterium]